MLRLAAKPNKFSHEFLKKLGFNSSNDRAVIPLLRGLGFINDNGIPTSFYDDLKDNTKRDYVLAERIKTLYNELYTLNPNIHTISDDEIKGAISRITGKDAKSVGRYFTTFKTLASIANFGQPSESRKEKLSDTDKSKPIDESEDAKKVSFPTPTNSSNKANTEFHYNIQIHLPATTEISVYNAIFKSLKETLLG